MFKCALVGSCLLAVALAYSRGAPEGVCDDMTPKHNVEPQDSSMPYKISVDKDKVKPTESVKILIGGDKEFKGFLVQVRDGDKPVGSFKISGDDKYAQAINCAPGKAMSIFPPGDMFMKMVDALLTTFQLPRFFGPELNNAATHKNSANKKNFSVEWRAPRTGGKKTYTVFATVAQDSKVYWAKKPTATIKVE